MKKFMDSLFYGYMILPASVNIVTVRLKSDKIDDNQRYNLAIAEATRKPSAAEEVMPPE